MDEAWSGARARVSGGGARSSESVGARLRIGSRVRELVQYLPSVAFARHEPRAEHPVELFSGLSITRGRVSLLDVRLPQIPRKEPQLRAQLTFRDGLHAQQDVVAIVEFDPRLPERRPPVAHGEHRPTLRVSLLRQPQIGGGRDQRALATPDLRKERDRQRRPYSRFNRFEPTSPCAGQLTLAMLELDAVGEQAEPLDQLVVTCVQIGGGFGAHLVRGAERA